MACIKLERLTTSFRFMCTKNQEALSFLRPCLQNIELLTPAARLVLQAVKDSGSRFGVTGEFFFPKFPVDFDWPGFPGGVRGVRVVRQLSSTSISISFASSVECPLLWPLFQSAGLACGYRERTKWHGYLRRVEARFTADLVMGNLELVGYLSRERL